MVQVRSAAGPAAAADESLDPVALDNLRALQRPGMPNVVKRVIERYLQSAPALVGTLHEVTVARPDPDAMFQAARSLKSGSANLGAMSLAGQCRKLERLGRDGSLDGAAEIVTRIDDLFTHVCDQLNSELDRLAA